MLPQEVIRHKRDGQTLSDAELHSMVQGITDGSIGDAQIAAFAMAIYFQGLNLAERVALTRAMTASGTVLDWSTLALPGPVLDKHSTGGVGDKVSLVLAPLIAACDGFVPMISGRGLSHTGGTLDKLDSIPGYNTTPDSDLFRHTVKAVGCAISGQTANLAPADGRLYAIRDVTATVDSIGLITASILSKKLAAGLQGLVMDVKTGSGAFMNTLAESRALAASIVTVARGAGLPTAALITDMNQVLGYSAGNALEVHEAIAYLTGANRHPRLHEVVMTLGVEMLQLGGLVANDADAHAKLNKALASGQAAERFAKMIAALGGPTDLLEYPRRYLPTSPVIKEALSNSSGIVSAIDVRAVGMAIVKLGGGRQNAGANIDYSVGLSDVCQLGDRIVNAEPLALVHALTEEQADAAIFTLRDAIKLARSAEIKPVIFEKLNDVSS